MTTATAAPRPDPSSADTDTGVRETDARYVFSQFYAGADRLRASIDAHFAHPEQHGLDHQVWNYWFVPDAYTYLRTLPDKVLGQAATDDFCRHLAEFVRDAFGMNHVTRPFLSLYVEGCGQALHNDSRNGAFGYVYSLTRWDERRFRGGETLIFREQDYWASGRFRESGAGVSFYELIPSRFNQLLLFDDRLLHAVPTVQGTLDPRQGRLVLHGHVSVTGPSVRGALAALPGGAGVDRLEAELRDFSQSQRGRFHGFATLAVTVAPDGGVDDVYVLVDRVLSTAGPGQARDELEAVGERIRAHRFPAAGGPSRVDIPVFFD